MFELRVLNGLHEGATLPLSGEAWALGNHDEADLQLCDENIQTQHASLVKQDDAWVVTPGQGEVYLAKGEQIKDGLSVEVDQPFQLSGVWLVVSEASAPWQTTGLIPLDATGKILTPKPKRFTFNPSFPVWFKPALAILSAMVVIVITGWFFSASPGKPHIENSKPIVADAEGLRSILSGKLEERDLNKVISIVGDNHGIELTGEVTKTQSAILNRLMQAMKNNYDIRIPLRNATTLKVLTLPFRIVEINAGKHANIVIEGGRRLFIGDMQSGFTLSGITKDTVQFTGPENISVKW